MAGSASCEECHRQGGAGRGEERRRLNSAGPRFAPRRSATPPQCAAKQRPLPRWETSATGSRCAGENSKKLRRCEAGWEATERTRSTIMTSEHDSASVAATSLLRTGEVCGARAPQPPRASTDAREVPAGVVGDGRSGKEDACECRRTAGTERVEARPVEVRAVIVAWKRGNARGAKGGRKANVQ